MFASAGTQPCKREIPHRTGLAFNHVTVALKVATDTAEKRGVVENHLTAEQAMLRDQLQRFVRRHGTFDCHQAWLHAGGDAANWAAYAENGWLGAGFPEETGGFGGGPAEIFIAASELGRGLMLEPVAANIIAGFALTRCAAPGQRLDLVSSMIAGASSLSLAFVEPSGAHDWSQCDTRLTPDGTGFRLDGRKIVAPAFAPGTTGGHFLVLARLENASVWRLAVVDSHSAGIDRQEYGLIDDTRAFDLAFRHVAVSAADCLVIGDEQLAGIMDFAAFVTCAETIGVMAQAFDITLDYVRQRQQFGAALGANQALQHRLVDMMMALRDAEALTRRAGEALAGYMPADDTAAAVATAKIQCAHAARKIAQEAVQMHGGVGTTNEAPISHYFKRLVRLGRLHGDAAYHKRRLAALMESADCAAAGAASASAVRAVA